MWLVVHHLPDRQEPPRRRSHWMNALLVGGRAERRHATPGDRPGSPRRRRWGHAHQGPRRDAGAASGGTTPDRAPRRLPVTQASDEASRADWCWRVWPRRRPGALGAVADGLHLGVHHPGAAGGVLVGHDPDRQLSGESSTWPGRDAAGAALVEVHGGDVRRRGRDQDRPVLQFGLLWPKFAGQWGAAFGVPFAFEGLFFFTEAVFISIYIFGWRRLKPWAHFWTGDAHRCRRHLQRLGRGGQRLDERARSRSTPPAR